MKNLTQGTWYRLLFFAIATLLIIISCSKDVDTLRNAVLNENNPPIDGSIGEDTSDQDSIPQIVSDEPTEKQVEYEIRTVVFPPVNDAFLQNGVGYNDSIVRLEEGRRTSYLMFDLSPIDSLEGQIVAASLEFVVNTDDGDGEIKVYEGLTNDWSELDLSSESAPETGNQLGEINQDYRINNTILIELDTLGIPASKTSLVLDHKDGDDLAFASKESAKGGSLLVVQYEVPVGTGEIQLPEPMENPVAVEEPDTDNSQEPQTEVPEPDEIEAPAEEEPAAEEPVTEEHSQEEPAPEEPVEEDSGIENPAPEEPAPLPPSNDAPTAVASANPTKGTLPLKVAFNGGSSSDDKAVVSYAWSFGDGGTSTSKNPEHTFSEEGTYEAKLVVKDEEGLSANATITIVVSSLSNEAPVAKVTTNTTSGLAPLEVKFTGSGSIDDSSIKSYAWNFQDGSTSNTANPTHTFTKKGSYSVELTVTDEQGLTDKETVSITVTEPENEAPKAKVSANVTSGQVPLQVKFTGSGSTDDDSIKSYAWNFKDGSTSNTANPTHTFEKAGTYTVALKVSDEQGLSDTATISITVNEPQNEAPESRPKANVTNGTAPLQVQFDGDDSTDDKGISSYFWDFKDGSTSNQANPSHTFGNPGTYGVSLTVADEDGLKSTKTVTVTVNPAANEAPNAQFSASKQSGEAPLKVDFNGGASTDDKGIVNYSWSIDGRTQSGSSTSYTFNNSGNYNVVLTVTDQEGLTSSQSMNISVTDPVAMSQIPCSVGGGYANETGEKIWCWNNVNIPNYSDGKGVAFSNGELHVDSECDTRSVTISGSKIRFKLDPTVPETPNWCSRDYNLRAEIRTSPWDVRHSSGTEEWFGWSYTFGSNYKIDQNSQWKFFQVHNGVAGKAPQIGLEIIHDDQFIGHEGGEIYVTNAAGGEKFNPTGITPRAGQTINVVVHAIWGNSTNGLLQVWINGNKVYDEQVATMLPGYNWAGNAKWGIYKWPWSNSANVNASKNQGIGYMETFMGDLRIITRKPGDPNYGKDSYNQVSPN